MASSIRFAQPAEDEILSRILANAFLPIWNHNWMQNIAKPVPPLPTEADEQGRLKPLSRIQERRRKFYHALIKLTRLGGGCVRILERQGQVAAILLWLYPQRRPSLRHMIPSGFGRIALWDYGLVSLYRVQMVFEHNLTQIAKANGIDSDKHAYVQMLAIHPSHAGHGYGAKLLQDMIDRHRKEFPNAPGILLDTTTMSARRVYRGLGFTELGTKTLEADIDLLGFRISRHDPEYESKRREALPHHEQVLMLLKN